jgi:transcriptional regulator with XRE-family HTH domain
VWTATETVAHHVRDLRRRRGWSTAKLAAHCLDHGVTLSAAAIERIEGGRDADRRRSISIDEAVGFAHTFGVSVVYLLTPPSGVAGDVALKITEKAVARTPGEVATLVRGDSQAVDGSDEERLVMLERRLTDTAHELVAVARRVKEAKQEATEGRKEATRERFGL